MATRPVTREPQPAKLSRPGLFGVVARERLFARLDEARRRPVVWITGPPGAGKTTLVASYLQARKLRGVWYQVDGGDADPASFFHYLAQAAPAPHRTKRQPLEPLRPEYLADLPGFTRRFFRDLYERLSRTAALVLDNYQDVPEDSSFQDVIREAVFETRAGLTVIVVSRADPPAQFARALANGIIASIGWDDLRLTIDETRAIAGSGRAFDDETLSLLSDRSGGWAAGLVLMTERLKQTGTIGPIPPSESMAAVFNYFAQQVFDRSPVATRELLTRTAFLSRVTVKAAAELTGNSAANALLDQLHRQRLFIDRRSGGEVSYQYHVLFREFLVSRVHQHYSDAEQRQLRTRSAELVEDGGNAHDALRLHVENADWDAATALILRHARSLIAQGRWLTLKAWIALLPRERVTDTPSLMLLQGSSLILIDPPKARTILARAFDRFAALDDEMGQFLAATGIVESCNIEFSAFTALDPWIAVLERLLQNDPVFPSVATRLRVHAAFMLATMLRQPGHPMLPSCVERVTAMLAEDIHITSKADTVTQLLQYFDFTGDLDAAMAIVAQAAPLFERSELSAFRRAGWLVFLSYHSALVGSYRGGFDALDQAQGIARQYEMSWFGFFDVFFRSLLYLMGNAPGDAAPLLQRLGPFVKPGRPADAAQYHLARTMLCQVQGEPSLAAYHGELCIAAARQTGGALFNILFPTVVATAYIEAGQPDKARGLVDAARALAADTPYRHYEALMLMVDAYAARARDDTDQAHHLLRQALTRSRETNSAYFFRWMAMGFRRMLAEALRAGIETQYACSLIEKFGVTAESPEVENWPWPIRIFALGRFAIVINGSPLRSERKTQKKPLEMLKVLLAQGGRDLNASALCMALWPDAADGGASSFEVTLRRLRKLLRNDDAVLLNDGKLALNASKCWVDTWTFERIEGRAASLIGGRGTTPVHEDDFEALAKRALDLYHGHFLPGDEEEAWLLGARQRLASKFLRLVARAGQRWQDEGEPEKAILAYRRALELDPLAEELYRRLMIALADQGREAEAIETYRRCRHMLSVVLGVKPSAETEAARGGLASSEAGNAA